MKIKTALENIKNYKIYLQVETAVHEFLQKKGYLKLDLPVLAPVLIPESYLEIFETEFRYLNKKQKLYLTPSPELFLKRLLARGIGDCYYLGKAFRNSEPNSSFHSSEFTMLEYYRVGFSYLQLADEILEMMRYISSRCHPELVSGSDFSKAKRQMPGQVRHDKQQIINFQDNKISLDKWEKFTVAEAFEKFAQISEKELFSDKSFMKKAEKKGYIVEGFSFQDVFSQIISQEVEPKLGENGYLTLLYDYPVEVASLAKLNKDQRTAKRVEFYINGIEIGGCCEELNNWVEQKMRFENQIKKRKRVSMIDYKVDSGFIKALQYGLPDCTGAGIGFERLAMIFANVDSIDKLKLINIY